MTISEIKKWAKEQGYQIIKDKGNENKDEPVQYYWAKIDDSSVTGVAPSVSKVAKAIFNHVTNDKWLEHQQKYEESKLIKDFSVTNYG